MSPEESIRTLPMIVLIGGRLALTDGSEVDSRQSAANEKTAKALQSALIGSVEWWSAVSSIVVPTLDDSEGGFAVIFGTRSIFRSASDGETHRATLRKFLRGAVGSVSVMRSGIRDSLPTGYRNLARLRGRSGDVDMGSIGVRFDDPIPRWCFVDGNEFYLRLLANHIGARVIVDTTDELLAFGDSGFYTEGISIEYVAPCEPNRPQVVVVPDTARTRERLDVSSAGRPSKAKDSAAATYVPGAPRAPADFLKFPVARAQCNVTGLLRAGQWEDAGGLEAARMLLLRRFDLKIGLWDLALNPVLRSTVLDSLPVQRASKEPAQAPAQALRRSERAAENATARRKAAQLAVGRVTATLQQELASLGWCIDDRGRFVPVPSRLVLELGGASSGDMRLSDHAARSMI